ncbi:VAMP5 protein, partial [Glareola pratincola]|nr:VAMP5 protein [Glareola pratincola]
TMSPTVSLSPWFPYAPFLWSPCPHGPYVPPSHPTLVSMVPLPCGALVPKVPVSPLSPNAPSPQCPRPCGPHGAHMSPPTCPQAGLAQCQREAEEVTELMKQNFARALERDGRLSDLDSRAQELCAMGKAFTRSTREVARQQRRGQRRWHLAAIGLAAFLLLLLALGLAIWLSRPAPTIVTITSPPLTPPGG